MSRLFLKSSCPLHQHQCCINTTFHQHHIHEVPSHAAQLMWCVLHNAFAAKFAVLSAVLTSKRMHFLGRHGPACSTEQLQSVLCETQCTARDVYRHINMSICASRKHLTEVKLQKVWVGLHEYIAMKRTKSVGSSSAKLYLSTNSSFALQMHATPLTPCAYKVALHCEDTHEALCEEDSSCYFALKTCNINRAETSIPNKSFALHCTLGTGSSTIANC